MNLTWQQCHNWHHIQARNNGARASCLGVVIMFSDVFPQLRPFAFGSWTALFALCKAGVLGNSQNPVQKMQVSC